mgnify:CR=1 FL=1
MTPKQKQILVETISRLVRNQTSFCGSPEELHQALVAAAYPEDRRHLPPADRLLGDVLEARRDLREAGYRVKYDFLDFKLALLIEAEDGVFFESEIAQEYADPISFVHSGSDEEPVGRVQFRPALGRDLRVRLITTGAGLASTTPSFGLQVCEARANDPDGKPVGRGRPDITLPATVWAEILPLLQQALDQLPPAAPPPSATAGETDAPNPSARGRRS